MDVKSLSGIAVVSIEDGEKVGTVDDVVFNLESRRVIGFRLGRTGLIRGGRSVVSMSDVESVGSDAVMIRNRSMVRDEQNEREFADRPHLRELTSLRVVTQDGAYVGNLATVRFDPSNGSITHLEVSGGSLMSMLRRNREIPADVVLSMGTDVVVVPDQYGPEGSQSKELPEDEEREVIQ